MKPWLYLINNLAHDLFTGIWFGCFVGLYTVHSRTAPPRTVPAAAAPLVADLCHAFFWLGAASMTLVILSGLLRFRYRREWDAMEGPVQCKRPILIVKHAVLGSAFLAGSLYAFSWTF